MAHYEVRNITKETLDCRATEVIYQARNLLSKLQQLMSLVLKPLGVLLREEVIEHKDKHAPVLTFLECVAGNKVYQLEH